MLLKIFFIREILYLDYTMYLKTEKPQEHKSSAAATSVSQKTGSNRQALQFKDYRPEAVRIREFQQMANSSEVIQAVFQPGSSYRYTGEQKKFTVSIGENKTREQLIKTGMVFDATEAGEEQVNLKAQGQPAGGYTLKLGINEDDHFDLTSKEGDWHKDVRGILDSQKTTEEKTLALNQKTVNAEQFENTERLKEVVKDEKMLHGMKGSANRSEMYKFISDRSTEEGQTPLDYAVLKYGEERGAKLVEKLTVLGEKYTPLVHDMGLAHEDTRVNDFVDFVKQLRIEEKEPDDIWKTLEAFRQSRKKVSLYQGMNLTPEETKHILTHGMDPTMLRYQGGNDPMHSLLAPQVKSLIKLSELEKAKRHIRTATRPLARATALQVEGMGRKTFQGEISGGEDFFHSFAKERKVSEYVASTPELSGIPKPNQTMRMMRVNVPDIDVIKPEKIDGGDKEFSPSKEDILGEMKKKNLELPEQTPYSDIESLIAGRVFPGEIEEEKL